MVREEIELSDEGLLDAGERSAPPVGEGSKCLFQLCGAAGQHGVEQPALGVEVVEQQLLVDAGPPRDLVHASTLEPTPRELVLGGGDDS